MKTTPGGQEQKNTKTNFFNRLSRKRRHLPNKSMAKPLILFNLACSIPVEGWVYREGITAFVPTWIEPDGPNEYDEEI